MRDPKRIDEVLRKLKVVWKNNPDQRLGQLIVNLVQTAWSCPDIFHLEDDELLKRIEELL